MIVSYRDIILKLKGRFRHIAGLIKSQRGISLIELVIALAITGAITGGITLSIFQTLDYSSRGNARMEAVKQVENAIFWLSRDAQMAQEVTVTADPDGFPVTFEWVEWEGDEITVIYSIASGEMTRSHSDDGDMVVARYINEDYNMTNCDYANWVFSFMITATVSGYPETVSESREGRITPRSN